MHDTGASRLERDPVDGRGPSRVRGGGARAPDRRAPRAGSPRRRAHGGEGPGGRGARAGGACRGPHRDGARPRRARRRGAEHAPLLPLPDLPRLQDASPGAALDRAPRERLARDRAGQRRRARRTSRRSFLTRLGTALAGTAALPLLPVARAATDEHPAVPDDTALHGEVGDPKSCNYWRHCAIDGFLCACCGGSQNTCPPGTEMSPLTWIGTCRNPGDGKDYIISYNDCCGQSLCMRCRCTRTEGERPLYLTMKNNDLLWCFGTQSRAVNCSVAVVLGVATRT